MLALLRESNLLLHVCLHSSAGKEYREKQDSGKKLALLRESNVLLHVCFHSPAKKNKENNLIQKRNRSLFSGSQMYFFTSAFILLQKSIENYYI